MKDALFFSFHWSTASLYKTTSYLMCKHPVAHVSSPSLLSLLILNQRRLILHCHVCSCPLERPLVVICTWLWLLQELENGCVFFPGKCRGLWQEAETQFIWHYCSGSHTWLHTPTAATDHSNSPVSWRPSEGRIYTSWATWPAPDYWCETS